tara:strand:- start:6313 stop:7122 length:810 start_codon:yes stop_codon:yes gene_type:complete
MNFTQWLEGQRDTASKFRSLLQNVPQEPEHHPEGDVLTHTKMVRGSIQQAVDAMKIIKPQMPILANLDFDVTEEELEILAMAAWLHDIGKHAATMTQPSGKITAYGHQDAKHFMPQINKFADIAIPQTRRLYEDNKELIDFLIAHHMDFMKGGFSKDFRVKWMDGKALKNDPKIKLLLILMMADKMGRGTKPDETPQDVHQRAVGYQQSGLQATYDRTLRRMQNITTHQSGPFSGDTQSFIKMLQDKGLDDDTIKKSVRNFEKKRGVGI